MYIRPINESDRQVIEKSLSTDTYHTETTADFFYQPLTQCNAYLDDKGPIFYVRGTAALRMDIQFVDNNDYERNRKALEEGFDSFAASAKASGFTELIFESNSPLLKRFCKNKFGFEEVKGELRKFL